MKKRLLALLLALVLMVGMLPTAFALDADEPAGAISAGAADAETLAEGETEEEAAEPEQPEAEEPAEEPEQAGEEPAAEPEEAAAKEAEVAAFAADTSGVEAYLMGEQLQNGYYKTAAVNSSYLNMDDDTYSADVPTGWNNYLQYENGTMTVFGTVDATYSGEDAVLRVESGALTINGAGALSLSGTDTTALYVKENSTADVVFDFTPSTSGQQLSIHSRGAVAVSGDLTIDNAGRIWVESKPSLTPDENDVKLYDTIIGNVYINASNVSIMNTAGGSCVKGGLTVRAEYLQAIAQSETRTTLDAPHGCKFDLTVDQLNIQNDRCDAVTGNITLRPYAEDKAASYLISGCSRSCIVSGDVDAARGVLSITNQGNKDLYPDFQANGAALHGNLTLESMAGLHISRQVGSEEPLIRGAVTLTNCYGIEANRYTISSGAGAGVALEGDLTLIDSALRITAQNDSFEEYKRCAISWGELTLENSHLTVYGYASITGYTLDGEYMWYVGDFAEDAPAYIKNEQQSLRRSLLEEKRYFDIYTGDKRIMKTERSARFLGKSSLDGVVGQSMRVAVVVGLTGDTLDLQKVRGYGYLYSSYKDGEEVKHYGLPASTDLSKYLTINTPAGGVWTVTTSGRTYQGDTELPLYIIGTATTTCEDVPLEMTISGDILASGEDLAVTEKDTVRWNIRASATGVDFDNIRTAEEFAKAIGGEEYAQVTGDTVTLRQNACAEKNITMTGDFTVDLNGHSISSANGQNDLTISSAKGKQTIRSNDANGKHNYSFIEAAGGELTLDTIWVGSVSALSGTLSVNRSTVISLKVSGGFAEASDSRLGFAVVDGTGDLTLRKTEITKDSATSLRVNGGKVSIKDGTQIPCIVLVTGGEVQIDGGTFSGYEGHWLQQEGGLVSVNNGNLTGTMLVMDGELNLLGGEYSSGEDGNLGLYQSGGKVTAENVYLASTAMKEEAEDGEIYYNHRCIWLDGGELTLKNTVVTGAVFINDGAKLEMTDSSIMTVNAVALYLDSSTAMITNGKLQGQNLAVNLGGKNASVTLNGGDLSGDIWGVLVGGGSFTMLDGTINGGKTGILVTGPKCKLTVTGGEVASPEVALYAEKGNTVQLSGGTFTGAKNAIFAENGTMKNWLAKDCEMSGDGLPDLFDPASESETGPGTVRIVEADYVGKAEAANEIMAQLPADSSEIEKDDLALIEAAEEAYDAASADKNVKKLLDKALVKRVKAARKAYDKNEKAANKVQAMIDDLPDVSELEYARHRKAVDKADKAFNKLTAAQRTFLTQDDVDTGAIGAETKLNACIKRIRTLENYEQTIKTAQAAFKKIPEWSKLKKSDESKVEAARKALDALLEQEKTAGGFIIPETDANRQKCEASIKAYDAFKKIAAEYRETYLNDLPSGNNVSKDSAGKINAAREAYDNLGKTEYPGATKNIQSFIDKKELTKLKNLEKQLAKNKKAALKVTKLIEKLPDPNASFTAKDVKAIDAAWKAYQALKSDAERSFVEGYDTLIACYYGAHPDQRPGVWSVIDCAYISFPKGEAVLNADVVDFEAKTTTSAVKKFSSTDLNEYYDDTDTSIDASLDAVAAKNFAYELVVQLQALTYGENPQDFDPLYDHLLKIAADKDGALSVKVGRYSNGAALNWAFGIHPYQLTQAKAEGKTVNLDDYTIKVVNGKPYLEITDDGQYSNASITPDKNDKDIALSSKTRFLVHNMDGTYSAYTGYKNVPSLIAHYAEVVFDADYTNELVAEVVYLTV